MKKILINLLLVFIGIVLLLYGAMMPLLSAIGIRTQGEITVIRREDGERDEAVPNRYSYSVGYEFALDDGTIICGNTKVIGNAYSAGISKGVAPVRYLKVFPYINALEADTEFSIGTIILLVAGAFLIVFVIRAGTKVRPKERSRKKKLNSETSTRR